MASPNFRLAAKFYSLPNAAEFQHSGDPAADSGEYAYHMTKTLDDYFPNDASSPETAKWKYLGEPRGLSGFTATWRLDEPGTWSMTISGDRDDPELAAMVAAIRPSQADRPRAFAVWQIDAETDNIPINLSKPFSANLVSAGTGDYASFPAVLEDLSGRQSWATRGMSGPILRIGWRFPQPGRVRVVIQGADWLWALQKTSQVKDYQRPGLATATDGTIAARVDFRQLVSELLRVNASYTLEAITLAELGDGRGETFEISLEASGQASQTSPSGVGLTTPVVSPVGLYGVICAFTGRAIAHLISENVLLGIYSTPPGQHSLLQVFQRLGERTGLVFRAMGAVVVWDYPGSEQDPDVVWNEGQDCQTTDLDDHIPEATNIWNKHGDYRRDWHVSLHAEEIVEAYGFIQASNVSVAAKPASLESEVAYLPPGSTSLTRTEIEEASDIITLEDIRAQNKSLLLSLADNLSGTTQPLWGDKTQFAVSFDLAASIEVRAGHEAWGTGRAGIRRDPASPPQDRRGLICWQVQITFNARAWGCSVSLGALADVAPAMLPYAVELPRRKKPKTAAPVSAGTGTGGGFTSPVGPAGGTGGGFTSPVGPAGGITGGDTDTPFDLLQDQAGTRNEYESATEEAPTGGIQSQADVAQSNRFKHLSGRSSEAQSQADVAQSNRMQQHARNQPRSTDPNIAQSNRMLQHARNTNRQHQSARDRRVKQQEANRAQSNRFSHHVGNARKTAAERRALRIQKLQDEQMGRWGYPR